HCHRAGGVAGYTAFLTEFTETDTRRLGYFKPPNSAGYTGNRPFDIVPGKPAESILLFRMESIRPKERMPEVGREIVHEEGIQLIREWLASLPQEKSGLQGRLKASPQTALLRFIDYRALNSALHFFELIPYEISHSYTFDNLNIY